jgi:hypothetical protein
MMYVPADGIVKINTLNKRESAIGTGTDSVFIAQTLPVLHDGIRASRCCHAALLRFIKDDSHATRNITVRTGKNNTKSASEAPTFSLNPLPLPNLSTQLFLYISALSNHALAR